MFPAHSHKKIFSQDVSLELCLAPSVENAFFPQCLNVVKQKKSFSPQCLNVAKQKRSFSPAVSQFRGIEEILFPTLWDAGTEENSFHTVSQCLETEEVLAQRNCQAPAGVPLKIVE